MTEQAPQPMFTPEELQGEIQVLFPSALELRDISIDHFRETGQNFTEWAEKDPHGAYAALYRVITDSRYKGNEGAAAQEGVRRQFDRPTTISVRKHNPTLRQRLTGEPPEVAHSEELARFTFGQQGKES